MWFWIKWLNKDLQIMKRLIFALTGTMLALSIFFNACQHEPDDMVEPDPDPVDTTDNNNGGIPCDPDTVYFVNTILPLLQSSCGTSGCHDASSAQDGVILTDYASIISTGKVKAFDPFDSEIYEKITESDPEDRMPPPPQNPLTADQINLIYKWIEQGARNNSCEQADCDTVNVTYSATVWPIIQNSCLGCHSGGSPSGGVSLADYSAIAAQAANGNLLGAIRHEQGYSPMPQNGAKLNDCTITQIEKWIENGSPNN
jgi:uncharacterized membrane protein